MGLVSEKYRLCWLRIFLNDDVAEQVEGNPEDRGHP